MGKREASVTGPAGWKRGSTAGLDTSVISGVTRIMPALPSAAHTRVSAPEAGSRRMPITLRTVSTSFTCPTFTPHTPSALRPASSVTCSSWLPCIHADASSRPCGRTS